MRKNKCSRKMIISGDFTKLERILQNGKVLTIFS